ncbi:MAG: hypothetical protein JO332_07255 [Planctomycetaceae bacterium]|nr:hypothetical protein [Planctomycetaceae bacterium]
MIITCWKCGQGYDIADGADQRAVRCPVCKNPPTNYFVEVGSPAYDRACELAGKGNLDAALGALEEALKGGAEPELADADPALKALRRDPRYLPLVQRYRRP